MANQKISDMSGTYSAYSKNIIIPMVVPLKAGGSPVDGTATPWDGTDLDSDGNTIAPSSYTNNQITTGQIHDGMANNDIINGGGRFVSKYLLGIQVPPSDSITQLLLYPYNYIKDPGEPDYPSDLRFYNLLLLSLMIKFAELATGVSYYIKLYQGNPDERFARMYSPLQQQYIDTLLYDGTNSIITSSTYNHIGTVIVSSNSIPLSDIPVGVDVWIKIYNTGIVPIKLNLLATGVAFGADPFGPPALSPPGEFPTIQTGGFLPPAPFDPLNPNNISTTTAPGEFGIYLPGYITPYRYTGSLLTTVNVGPTRGFTEPRYAMAALADGGTMIIDAGTYYLPIGIGNLANDWSQNLDGINPNQPNAGKFTNLTIIGAGAGRTIFNGRGGTGLVQDNDGNYPYRLKLGKAFVYTNAPLNISGISFINCGGADGVGDGEAGIYAEDFLSLGTVTIDHCSFDGNENGIFSPTWTSSLGNNVDIIISNCDFSYNVPNGQSKDGVSHDLHISCHSLTVNNSNFYGQSYGHSIRCQSPVLTINNSYISRGASSCIDMPDGGTLVVNGSILTNRQDIVNNPILSTSIDNAYYKFISYANETTSNGLMAPVFHNCQIIAAYTLCLCVSPQSVVFHFTDDSGTVQQSWVSESWPTAAIHGSINVNNLDDGTLNNVVVSGLITGPSPTGTYGTPPLPPAPISGPIGA